MLKQIDHIGIAVFDLDASLKKYERLLKVKPRYIETLEQVSTRIAFVPVGDVMLELLEPATSGKGPVAEFLAQHGEGINHIAYRVDNLASLLNEMKTAGVKLRDEKPRPGGHGSLIAFLSPEETDSVLTELVERHGEF